MKSEKREPTILSENTFPVIGIGASAGGLDAFKRFVRAIPEDSGMAYVLVQHLDPNHESLLPELLQKVTNIPVIEISDDIEVIPDHVYIIPSNRMLVANDGVLKLSPRPDKGKSLSNMPIDVFFSSLAEVHQSHAIGVILSGTASDGTKGLKAIKDHGGITFAQDEESAAFKDMPASAIQAGLVDFILPPEAIPQKLLEIKNDLNPGDGILPHAGREDEIFRKVLSLLRTRKGTDFTYYKQTTIRRRILRRVALTQSGTAESYLTFLQENKAEQDDLYQDLLIPVTTFFRDKKIFDHLCESVFPHILKEKGDIEPLRLWVAGCSTGQEAYSLAMCLKEFLGDEPRTVQIFATDISEPAIAKARKGIYTKSETEEIGTQRLQEFFTKTPGGYQVSKELRNMCVFAVHNFIKGAPFVKIDFVSCRNVLIYMKPYLQKKAFNAFHYALNNKGLLLLGRSETSSSVPDLFATSDKDDRLFIRKDTSRRSVHVTAHSIDYKKQHLDTNMESEVKNTDFQKAADDLILNKYTPAGVVVNEMMDIVHFRGDTTDYLQQKGGKPSHNLLKMAKDGLAFELRNLLHHAKKTGEASMKDKIQIEIGGNYHFISVEVAPLPNMADPHYLIIFNRTAGAQDSTPVISDSSALSRQKRDKKDLRIQQLENDMVQTHEDIRNITEEQDAANDELQNANEELLSGSEELQSLNEELEASKEELQSTNEELTVLNQELSSLNEQVTAARNYAESIVATIREPLLVLDKTLRIKSANSAFYKAFQVSELETVGVFIYDLGNQQWNIPKLRTLLEENLPRKSDFENFEVIHNFTSIGERVMLLSVCEMAGENEEKLILLAIEDITERKQHQTNDLLFSKGLETKVHQRTVELSEANELLRLKNEELGKMNRELESFSYVSSHDLQEPLRKIQTFASRILEKEYEALSDKGKEYFNRMNSAANRMQTLIEDLLAYSHTNITERTFEKTDLRKIVDEVKAELSETILKMRADIVTGKLGKAIINPFQFRQVIVNLISNSLKFSKPGIPSHIVIKSRIKTGSQCQHENPVLMMNSLLPNKNYCNITFTDNGIGFDPKYQERIFVVFQRLHGKEEYPGTGIGLAIVKKIVENHNGAITAMSKLDEGAKFDIYIPA